MGKLKINPTRTFVFSLCGFKWTAKVFGPGKFEYMWPGTLAIMITGPDDRQRIERTINFRGPKVSKDTIAHELMHAFLSYRRFSTKSWARMEENYCEVIGKHHDRLYKLTNKLYNKLNSRSSRASCSSK